MPDATDADLPPSGQRRTVTRATSSPHLATTSLTELREYRERLRAEEERISYWRRLIHARMDLLDAMGDGSAGGGLDVDQLARVLGDTGSGQARAALHRVRAADPLPDLPDLAEVWAVPTTPDEAEEVRTRLRAAEERLTGYRRALHERIDEATADLIIRYRDQPTLALQLLG